MLETVVDRVLLQAFTPYSTSSSVSVLTCVMRTVGNINQLLRLAGTGETM